MSMISAQVERLREIADFLESDPRTQATAPEIRCAADTIWELRNKLAGTVDQSERITELEAENVKLREFVTEIMHYAKYSNPDCGLCKHYNECWADDALSLPTGCIICNEARELGIEVER